MTQMSNQLFNQLVTQMDNAPKSGNPSMVPYKIGDTVHKVPIWSHPGGIANRILNIISHTKYFGIQVVSPPGSGKTTVAKVIAHHLHKKNPNFVVRVETEKDTHAFENLDRYIMTLPKKPTIVIFDDVSGVFGRMKEQDIDKNFETLTRVRWVLDPDGGNIPFIPILTYHYSKVVEKKFRSQNGMTIFCTFGNEEKTNADTIAPRKTAGRMVLNQFEQITETMFPQHYFDVRDPHGGFHRYDTDKPFRASCVISGNVGSILLTSKDDVCHLCNHHSKKKKVNGADVVQMNRDTYGMHGVQGLRLALAERGVKEAINQNLYHAMEFAKKTLNTYAVDYNEIVEAIYKQYKTGAVKKKNKKIKAEREAMELLDKIAFDIVPDVKNMAKGKFDPRFNIPDELTDEMITKSA